MHPAPDCNLCSLSVQGRTAPVPGLGPITAHIMLVGEAPGATEDRLGIPFVGAAGKVLDRLLAGSNLDRRSVYITNVVKCRPPQNREPLPNEEQACTMHHLTAEIAAVNPLLIVAIGKHASTYLLPDLEFGAVHGKPQRKDGRVVLPVYHPAAGLHNPAVMSIVEHDFAALQAALDLAQHGERPIRVVDGVAPCAPLIALDTETNIGDGRIVAVSMSIDGVISYVQRVE